jgi:hypothetical protein
VIIKPVAVSEQNPVDVSNQVLVVSNRSFKALGSRLLLPFDQEDYVAFKALMPGQVGGGIQRCQNRTFIVRDPSSVQEPVDRGQLERICPPLRSVRLSTDDIVVAIEE